MNKMKLRGVLLAVAGAFAAGTAAPAMADASSDIIYTLMAKGVLTEEEGHQLLEGRDKEIESDKKANKGKIKIADFIDSATVYGDIRARYEYRSGEDQAGIEEDRNRGRYKMILGVKSTAGDFYSDLALSMGAGGRSDNATFGSASNGGNNKEAVYVKRAMLGWKATDWLSLEAGRMANPLYTTSMVWDADLTFEGVAEKIDFKSGNVNWFGNFVQSQYLGDRQDYNIDRDRDINTFLAFQGGAKWDLSNTVSAKAAVTFTTYTNKHAPGASTFVPGLGTATTGLTGNPALGSGLQATNDLRTIEIPAEIGFKLANNMKFNVFGEYVKNLDGDDRFDAAVAAGGANAAVIRAAGNDDKAWLVGIGLDQKKGKSAQKGDWSAKLWYQDVGIYALDPNAVDSDFMDSRLNMKGVVFKGEYLFRDNVSLNLAAGHATRKNDRLAAVATSSDINLNLDKYDLLQLDVTYKF